MGMKYIQGDLVVTGKLLLQEHYSKGLTYTLTDGEYTVIGIGTCTDNCIIIPSIIDEYPVTRIHSKAFYQCDNLTSVIIPDSVTDIGDWAFMECYQLNNVTIGNSVTRIGYEAFKSCRGLMSVTIGNSVRDIAYKAFIGCSKLTSIIIPSSVTHIGEKAFVGCTNVTISCEANSKPDGWHASWNEDNHPVVWGTKIEPLDVDINSKIISLESEIATLKERLSVIENGSY